ncbi:hypothetical protein TWF106_008776 [Orbilia oligospora]|uniref:Uncharacterized protein n=1 Tax=Orbilia oligospora TaxID=2813651 RepID=A0A7C8QJ04_ORBOL|nr:hypothetical protein TWF106_008776 [Orbilia oligospora]
MQCSAADLAGVDAVVRSAVDGLNGFASMQSVPRRTLDSTFEFGSKIRKFGWVCNRIHPGLTTFSVYLSMEFGICDGTRLTGGPSSPEMQDRDALQVVRCPVRSLHAGYEYIFESI